MSISPSLALTPHAAEISSLVDGLVRARKDRPANERRAHVRHPYAKLMSLIPVNKATLESVGEPISVVSKEFSAGGIGFFHHEVIPYRFALVPVELEGLSTRTWLLTKMRWCRFLEPGWYESGGQFVKTIVDPPFGIH